MVLGMVGILLLPKRFIWVREGLRRTSRNDCQALFVNIQWLEGKESGVWKLGAWEGPSAATLVPGLIAMQGKQLRLGL